MEIIDNRHEFTNGATSEPLVRLVEAGRAYDAPQPILDRILISRNPEPIVFAGTNFIMPDIAKQKPDMGIVVAVGAAAVEEYYDAEKEKMSVRPVCKPGDIVKFGMYNAEDVEEDGEIYTIVRKGDIKFVRSVTYVATSH